MDLVYMLKMLEKMRTTTIIKCGRDKTMQTFRVINKIFILMSIVTCKVHCMQVCIRKKSFFTVYKYINQLVLNFKNCLEMLF